MKLTVTQLKRVIKEAILEEQVTGAEAYILYARSNSYDNRVAVYTSKEKADEAEKALNETGVKTFLYKILLDPSLEETLTKGEERLPSFMKGKR